MPVMEKRLWVEVHVEDPDAVVELTRAYGAEVLRGTLRRLGAQNVSVEALVASETVDQLSSSHEVRVLGDAYAMMQDARQYAARMNRFASR